VRRIFGPKRDEVTGEWGILHKNQIYVQYLSPDIIRMIKKIKIIGGEVMCYVWGQAKCIQDFGRQTSWKEITCKTKANMVE